MRLSSWFRQEYHKVNFDGTIDNYVLEDSMRVMVEFGWIRVPYYRGEKHGKYLSGLALEKLYTYGRKK